MIISLETARKVVAHLHPVAIEFFEDSIRENDPIIQERRVGTNPGERVFPRTMGEILGYAIAISKSLELDRIRVKLDRIANELVDR